MKKIVFLFFLFALLTACEKYPKKISEDDLINRIINDKLPRPGELKIYSLEDKELSLDSVRVLESTGKYFQDFYVNKDNQIVKLVVRPITKADELFIEKVNKKLNEGPELRNVDVNCDDVANLLQVVYERDQGMREEGESLDKEIDHKNLELVVSIIERCGMPTLENVDEIQMAGIWLVLQHAPPEYQSKYISLLEKSAENGDIDQRTVMLMKDRALMHDGKPQMYGTQILNGELHELFEPEYVDQRRAEIGLGPLKEYLKRFDVEFNVDQKRK